MKRGVVCTTLAVILAAFVFAGEVKEIKGTVTSVSDDAFVIIDSAGKHWRFAVDSKKTEFVAKGSSQKIDKLRVGGEPAALGELLPERSAVQVTYAEKGGRLVAERIALAGTGGGGDPCYPPKCKCKDGTCDKKCCKTK